VTIVTPPSTYAEWSACLDLFESGLDDVGVLAAMRAGRLSWTSGVAECFAERIGGVVNVRLTRCADRLTRELRHGGDEVTLVRALGDTRRTLALLQALADVPVFPAMLREHLTGSLDDYATRTQQSLEDSARQDRSGRAGSIVRNNSLLRYRAAASPDAGPGALLAAATIPPGPRRRNILA
jgi:hypothetical protein